MRPVNSKDRYGGRNEKILTSSMQTISSQDISRIQSCVSLNQPNQKRQDYRNAQFQQDNISQWLDIYTRSNAQNYFTINTAHNSPLMKYQVASSNYKYFKLTLKKLQNIRIDPRQFSSTFSIKTNPVARIRSMSQPKPEYYMQFSLQFINLQTQQSIKGTLFLSEYFRLQSSENAGQKYQVNQAIQMYFFLNKSYEKIGIRMKFFSVLCQKDKTQNCVIDKVSIGSIFINLYNSWSQTYFLNVRLEQYFDFQNVQQQQQLSKKTDEYTQIQIKQSPSVQFITLSSILLPLKIYTPQAKILYTLEQKFPLVLSPQSIKYSASPYTLNFQLSQLSISQSQIFNLIKGYQKMIRLRYEKIQRIHSTQIKEYRMVLCCHNGQKLISMNNSLLKKNQRKRQGNRTKRQSLQRKRQKQTYNKNTVVQTSKQNHLYLFLDNLPQLQLTFELDGVVVLCQIFCRLQIKFYLLQSTNPISQTCTFPLSYFMKPIISLQNDIKYSQNLLDGELLTLGGIQGYLQQQKRKQEYLQKKLNAKSKGGLQSFNKVALKAQAMTQSTIQFYVFKQKKEKENAARNYSTIMTQQAMVSTELSQSFGKKKTNDLNRLLMQKARIQRQRMKMKQKIHRLNIENSKTIPLLDTTEMKFQIYQQNVMKMKQSKQELKQTLNSLKSKIDQFQRKQQIKKQLIFDSFKKVFGKNNNDVLDLNSIGQKLIGAKGGRLKGDNIPQDQLTQETSNELVYVIQDNDMQNTFIVNELNIAKLVRSLKSSKYIEVTLQDCEFFGQWARVMQYQIYAGFNKIIGVQGGSVRSDNSHQTGPLQPVLRMQIPLPGHLTSNLLSTMLFSPFQLHFLNTQTNICIGSCFIYLDQLCNKTSSQGNIASQQIVTSTKLTYLWNKSVIIGKVNTKTTLQNEPSQRQNTIQRKQSFNLVQQIQNKLSLKNQSEDRRKVMRIQNFKRKLLNTENGNKISQEQKRKGEELQRMKQKLSIMSGQEVTIVSHTMNLNIFKVNLQNSTNSAKTYEVSICDPDKEYFQPNPVSTIDELGLIYDPQFLQGEQKLLQINPQTQKLYLPAKSTGLLLFGYSSTRRAFPETIKRIPFKAIQQLDGSYNSFFGIYNHPHSISTTIASQQGIQKHVQIRVKPLSDYNTLNLVYYFDTTSEFLVPLPNSKFINKSTIFFQHQYHELVEQENGKLFINGYTPQLNKVSLFQVLVYPHPNTFTCLARELKQGLKEISDFESQQIIKQLVFSQKMMNLSFQIWGCKKVNRFQIRLFQKTAILWQVDNQLLMAGQISQSQPSMRFVYLCSQNVNNLGFRSSKHQNRIQAYKKTSLNYKQKKTIIKSVISSQRIGQKNVLVQVQNQKCRQQVISRYLIGIFAHQPHLTETLIFKLSFKKLQQLLSSSQTYETPLLQQQPVSTSFLIDVSSILTTIPDRSNFEQMSQILEKNIKFHSTQIFIKIKSIVEERDTLRTKKYFQQLSRDETVQGRNKREYANEVLKNQFIQQKSGKKIVQLPTTNNIYNNKPYIVCMQLQIIPDLFLQHMRLKNLPTNYAMPSKRPLSLFQSILLTDMQTQISLAKSIIGLQYKEHILYYSVHVCQQQQKQLSKQDSIQKTHLIRQTFEQSQIKLDKNKKNTAIYKKKNNINQENNTSGKGNQAIKKIFSNF